MKTKVIFLVFLNLSFTFTIGTNPGMGFVSEDIWTDFTFCSCYPSIIDIYDNQVNRNGYSVDDRVEPEQFIFELNITKLSNTHLEITRHVHVMTEFKTVVEFGSEYINTAGYHSFNLNANRIYIQLIANSTELELHSIQGQYRLSADNGSVLQEWNNFSLWNCSPTGKELFDYDKNVHNMTTKLNISEIGNGTFRITYFRGGIEAIAAGNDYKTNGSFVFNDKGSSGHITYYGENGTFVKGSYLLEDFGVLYRDLDGFPFYFSLAIAIVIPFIRKIRKKQE